MEYTQKENLIIHSYLTTEFLMELKSMDFLNSDYYKNASFNKEYVKESLSDIGILNQGAILMILYALLEIPKELLENDLKTEFKAFNKKVDELKSNAEPKCSKNSDGIDYIRHIRNALAHARVNFNQDNVIFTDISCEITITYENLGLLVGGLQDIFKKYIETLKIKYNMG